MIKFLMSSLACLSKKLRQLSAFKVPDPKLKYQQLLAYAKKLPPLPAEEHTEDNKVRGCVSQACPCSLQLGLSCHCFVVIYIIETI